MFVRNVGKLDRAARIVLGLGLLIAFLALPDSGARWLLLIGLVPLVTGLVSSCPLYSVLGISTCSQRT